MANLQSTQVEHAASRGILHKDVLDNMTALTKYAKKNGVDSMYKSLHTEVIKTIGELCDKYFSKQDDIAKNNFGLTYYKNKGDDRDFVGVSYKSNGVPQLFTFAMPNKSEFADLPDSSKKLWMGIMKACDLTSEMGKNNNLNLHSVLLGVKDGNPFEVLGDDYIASKYMDDTLSTMRTKRISVANYNIADAARNNRLHDDILDELSDLKRLDELGINDSSKSERVNHISDVILQLCHDNYQNFNDPNQKKNFSLNFIQDNSNSNDWIEINYIDPSDVFEDKIQSYKIPTPTKGEFYKLPDSQKRNWLDMMALCEETHTNYEVRDKLTVYENHSGNPFEVIKPYMDAKFNYLYSEKEVQQEVINKHKNEHDQQIIVDERKNRVDSGLNKNTAKTERRVSSSKKSYYATPEQVMAKGQALSNANNDLVSENIFE